MNVVSIDWDYFFGDMTPYDWAHNESPVFFELLWGTRVTARNLLTGEFASDVMHPDPSLHNLIPTLYPERPPSIVVIRESHADLYSVLQQVGDLNTKVWNFDQHHDLGYGENDAVDCGNWAEKGLVNNLIGEYNLIYPDWRAKQSEDDIPIRDRVNVTYKIPQQIPWCPVLFICRSPSWTPPWSDHLWMEFIEQLGIHTNEIESVRHKRSPSITEILGIKDSDLALFKAAFELRQ